MMFNKEKSVWDSVSSHVVKGCVAVLLKGRVMMDSRLNTISISQDADQAVLREVDQKIQGNCYSPLLVVLEVARRKLNQVLDDLLEWFSWGL